MSMTPTYEIQIRGKTYILNHKCGSDKVLDSLRMGFNRESRRQQVQAIQDLESSEYGPLPIKTAAQLKDAAIKAFANPIHQNNYVIYEFAKTREGLPYMLAPLFPKIASVEVGAPDVDCTIDEAKRIVKDLELAELSRIATKAIAASGFFLVPNSNGPNEKGQEQNADKDPTDSPNIES